MRADRDPIRFPFGHAEGLELHARYAEARAAGHLFRVRPPYGEDAWLACRHADVKAVLADPRFSRFPPPGRDQARLTRTVIADPIAGRDRDEHVRIRRFLGRTLSFNAGRLAALRANVRTHAREHAARVLDAGPGTDLCSRYAEPVALLPCYDLFGVSIDRQKTFARWFEAFAGAEMTAEDIAERRADVLGYVAWELDRRRAAPRDDFLTHMAAAVDTGELDRDLLDDVFLELILVCDNVSIELMGVLFLLLSTPHVLDAAGRDPGLMPRIAEECLRLVPFPPDVPFARAATEDVEVGGTLVRAGDQVLLAYAAANRDADAFDDPDTVRLDRPGATHLSFGYGAAHCMGAPLVRVIMQVALAELLEAIPGVRLAVPAAEVRWRTDVMLRCPESLPATW